MFNCLWLHSRDILVVPVTAVKPINMFPPQHPESLSYKDVTRGHCVIVINAMSGVKRNE